MIHYGDITKIKGDEVPAVDVITGGSPCQDLSVAGKRAGLAGERSGLFMEQIRLIKEMRNVSSDDNRRVVPRFMVWENVYGAFSSNNGEDFRAVLEETAKVKDKNATIPRPADGKWQSCGVILGDGYSLAWRGHDAQYWGVPQRRKRICLLADFEGGAAPRLLFESELWRMSDQGEPYEVITDFGTESRSQIQSVGEGLPGNTQQSREKGQDIADNLEGSFGEAISFQERAGKPGGGKGILIQNEHTGALSTLNNQNVVYGISSYDSNAMKSANPNSGIYETDTTRTLDLNGGNPACNQGGMIVLEGNGSRPSHQGDGYAKSETMYTLNTTEHHAVCIENHPNDSRVKISSDGMVQTLSSRMGTGGGNVPMVMEPASWDGSQTSPTLTANNAGGNQRMPDKDNFNCVVQCMEVFHCTNEQEKTQTLKARDYKDPQIVAYGLDRASYNQGHNAKFDFSIDQEKIGPQTAMGPGAVSTGTVRRLTPTECLRLQGYPDGWYDIGEWTDSKGKKHKEADAPKYKAAGNSIALPFWKWLAKRICAEYDHPLKMASLFDGIGGFPLSFSEAGAIPVWASEIEEFPIAVTKARFK